MDWDQLGWNLIISLGLAAVAAWAFHRNSRRESEPFGLRKYAGRSGPMVEPLLLPVCLVMLFVLVAAIVGLEYAGTTLAFGLLLLFLNLSAYYALLLCLLPLLRRFVSARACAALWLLPNFMYYTLFLEFPTTRPLFVITLPRRWLVWLLAVWGAGFLAVLLWQVVSHFRYRRFLLRRAVPVEQGEILALWEHEGRPTSPTTTMGSLPLSWKKRWTGITSPPCWISMRPTPTPRPSPRG